MSPNARGALRLAACVLLAAAMVTGMHRLTRDRIAQNQHQAEAEKLAIVLPPALHDNDVPATEMTLRAPRWLGSETPLRAWRATRGGAPQALVLEAVAPDGYAAPIHLLIGVDVDGRVLGIRVVSHAESRAFVALDDNAAWLQGFPGRSLDDPPRDRWRVRRDGGAFDQFAGATVTPRAIVQAVRRVLEYVDAHGAQLHAAPAGAMLTHDDGPAD